jgi:uncharacterized membrane protein (UPF0127 family)
MLRILNLLMGRIAVAAALCATFLCVGCDQGPMPHHVDMVFVKESGERTAIFRVEVANTPETRAQASDSRRITGTDRGLLLWYAEPNEHLVSNRNGPQPVDIIFIGPNARVVGIIGQVPANDSNPRTVGASSASIVFLEGGMSQRLGLSQGSMVLIQGALAKPT